MQKEEKMNTMNQRQFDYKRIAEGYAKDRPFLHSKVMELVKRKMLLTQNYKNGIDIGCGAGLSTKALRMICDNVTGTDISPEMVMVASALYQGERFWFKTCQAEEIQAEIGSVDIVTAAGVINWVDEKNFLPHIYDILTPKGLLLIYDFWITDKMEHNEAYTKWWHEEYLSNFPKPKRKENKWTNTDINQYGFKIFSQEEYTIPYEMDKDYFIRFMLLQSNVIAQVEEKGRNIEEVRAWFYTTLSTFWGEGAQKMIFQGYNWYINKI